MCVSVHACVCVSVRVCVCACVYMYTGDMSPRIFWENTSLRLQSEVKLILAIILHLSPANINLYYVCIHPCMRLCVYVRACVHACVHICMCLHVSEHNIMYSAGPEVAVLD